jgi:tetratricopeptide (TPR) repeat protein
MKRLSSMFVGPALAACAFLAFPAGAQETSDVERCWNEFEEFGPEERIAACTALIAVGDDGSEDAGYLYGLRGWGYFQVEDFARALDDYSRAVHLLPGRPEAYSWRANAHFSLGDYASAAADFATAIRLDPESPELHAYYHDLGLSHAAMEDWESALADFTTSLDHNPYNAGAFAQRGHAFLELGQTERAIDDYSLAIEFEPDDPWHWNARCWARAVGNRDLDALADCDWALTLDPYLAPVLDSRGFVHLRQGEWEAAAEDYRRANLLEPDFASAHYGRGLALLRIGRHAESEAALAMAVDLDPAVADGYAVRGLTP